MRSKTKLIWALVLSSSMILIIPCNSYGGEWLSVNAYYKSFFTVYHPHDYESDIITIEQTDFGAIINRVRLNMSVHFSRNVILSTSYNLIPQIRDSLFAISNLVPESMNRFMYRFDDLDSRLYPSPHNEAGSFTVWQNLDRANLTIKTRPVDIILGRQSIAWGMAHVINPTDIIAPYTYEELDTEDRVGVDGIRLRAPVGFMGELDAGVIFGEDFKNDHDAWFLRFKYYQYNTDFSVILLDFRENFMVGFNLARSIGGAGFWLEAARVFVENMHEKSYFRLSTGTDYSFSGKTYGFLEYHFNGPGADEACRYLDFTHRTAYTEGGVYLLGKHYLIPGLIYRATPLVSISAEALTNVADQSAYINIQGEYNIAANVYISAGIFLGIGKRPVLEIGDDFVPTTTLNSEFGAWSDMYYTSIILVLINYFRNAHVF